MAALVVNGAEVGCRGSLVVMLTSAFFLGIFGKVHEVLASKCKVGRLALRCHLEMPPANGFISPHFGKRGGPSPQWGLMKPLAGGIHRKGNPPNLALQDRDGETPSGGR